MSDKRFDFVSFVCLRFYDLSIFFTMNEWMNGWALKFSDFFRQELLCDWRRKRWARERIVTVIILLAGNNHWLFWLRGKDIGGVFFDDHNFKDYSHTIINTTELYRCQKLLSGKTLNYKQSSINVLIFKIRQVAPSAAKAESSRSHRAILSSFFFFNLKDYLCVRSDQSIHLYQPAKSSKSLVSLTVSR